MKPSLWKRISFSFALASSLAASAGAQVPGLPVPSPQGSGLGAGVRREGIYLTAPITVDGAVVFRVATQQIAGNKIDIETRVDLIEGAIATVLAQEGNVRGAPTIYDPETLQVRVQTVDGQPVVVASDKRHPAAIAIATVTASDAGLARQPAADVADSWRTKLEGSLLTALQIRQPNRLRQNVRDLSIVVAILLAFSALLAYLVRRIRNYAARIRALEPPSDGDTEVAAFEARRDSRLSLAKAMASTIVWILVLLWFGTAIWALLLFPVTAPLGRQTLQTASVIAGIWIVAGLVNRIVDIVSLRFETTYGQIDPRRAVRVPTITKAILGFKSLVIYFGAILLTLGALGFPVASVVTFGGIAALMVTFSAQNLLRDWLNGFLVLLEDQYIVGDRVVIAGYEGVVEDLTLRVVQIRDDDGKLTTIPHSSATTVVNLSRPAHIGNSA